jgi:hypothetical protein
MQPTMDAIEAFLDAADEVLNSSTFLVRMPFQTGNVWEDLRIFVASAGLQRALLEADIARSWFNLHRFLENGEPAPIPGCLAREGFRFTEIRSNLRASEYLEAMLRADTHAGNFISFYRRVRSPEEAHLLTAALLGQLFAGHEPALHVLEPDFFRDAPEDLEQLHYFEGCGCDNAALLVHGSTGYLLLSNGMP